MSSLFIQSAFAAINMLSRFFVHARFTFSVRAARPPANFVFLFALLCVDLLLSSSAFRC